MRDTIFAPATAPGRSAIAVVRLSGPATAGALRRLAGALPRPRRASLRRLRSAEGETLDQRDEVLVVELREGGTALVTRNPASK